MSLLEDLRDLDLSAVVSARGSISIAVQSPDLQAVLGGGAAQTALAGLGQSLASFRGDFSDPSALLRPLVDAVGALRGHLSTDGLPIARYLSTVSDGVTVALRLIEGLDRDPLALGRAFGGSLGDHLGRLTRLFGSYTNVDTQAFGQLRSVLDSVDRGVSRQPLELAHFAVDVLLPFPRQPLLDVRNGLDGVFEGIGRIALPPGRLTGLLAALDAVNAAAVAADRAALDRALRELGQVRANTIEVLQGDLLRVVEQLGRLQLGHVLDPIARASAAIRSGRDSILEFMAGLEGHVRQARALVASVDPALIGDFLDQVVDQLAAEAQARIVAPIEAQVVRLEAFLRDLFRALPLRSLRAEITRFLHGVAQAVQDAGLDRVARSVHEALATVRETLSPERLTADVRQAIERAGQVISRGLDGLLAAMERIGQGISGVAEQARLVLDRAAAALAGFADAMRAATDAIDHLGVDAAADQVVETLRRLREKAEALLSAAPLPEPMRPLVEQLISTLESIDFDTVFEPVRSAVAQIQVPPEVGTQAREVLAKVKEALDNIIPVELIASIEAEIAQALDVIRNFDPAALLGGVTGYLDDAAQFIEGLDPRPAVGQLRAPFQAVLDTVDLVEPRRLLRPVIEAYDSVLSRVQLPSADLAVRRMGELINATGEAVGQAATAPARAFVGSSPGGGGSGAAPGGTAGGSAGAGGGSAGGAAGAAGGSGGAGGAAIDALPFRPGDIVRIFGYVPAKLREALQALDAGPAGDVLRTIDGLTGGLARDIRRLRTELARLEDRLEDSLDEALSPLGAAQVRAQLGLRASFSADGVRLDASMAAVAAAGPGALRHELALSLDLVRDRVRDAAGTAGGAVGAALERAAMALDTFRLSGLTGGVDGLLAALDPEPLARELDQLVLDALRRGPELLAEVQDRLVASIGRLRDLINELNPVAQAQKFFRVLDVLKQELDVLNPSVLADELGEMHLAIRRTIAAYDPAAVAADLFAVLQQTAASLRSLNPATLLGDLSFLDDILDRVEAAVPTRALAGVGASLTEVGNRLAALDLTALLDAVNQLGPRVEREFEDAVKKIRDEIVALLESIRYANANASVSVSARVSVGG